MSVLSVAAALMYSPLGHASRTDTHASPLVTSEKDVPRAHDEHTRSAWREGASVMPLPGPQFFHWVQARSEVSVGYVLIYMPLPHTKVSAHTRLDVSLCFVNRYCVL
jgi:hypothetical protein